VAASRVAKPTRKSATLAVIIPVGPGDRSWRTLLPDLAALPERAEIILVAAPGESPAGFQPTAFALPCRSRWITAPVGRAQQQNAGAAQSGADVLWFVHADSRLTAATLTALNRYLASPHGLGYFDLRFLGDGPLAMSLNALGAWIRSHWLRLPFGDQGFILMASDFQHLGGFDSTLVAGEDHALVWQARRMGVKLRALHAPIHSSARKYAKHGWWRMTWHHLAATWQQARRFSNERTRNNGHDEGASPR